MALIRTDPDLRAESGKMKAQNFHLNMALKRARYSEQGKKTVWAF